jgi:vitamin B12 transporter
MRIHSISTGLALGVLAAAAATSVHADSGEALEPLVITATRLPTPQSQLASSVTIITAEQIAAMQARTLPDALKYVPGLNLVQTGGPGGQTSVFMRGTNSNHVKVLVDGIDVSDPSTPNAAFDFGPFLIQDVERIEVLRGSQSGLYGSDAIGGVINIITKSGSGPLKLAAALEGGSFQTFNQAAGLSGSQDAFSYTANVQHLHVGSTPVTPLDLLPPGQGRRNDYNDNLTASTKLGYALSQDLDFGFVGRYTDSHLHFTGDAFDPVTFASYPDPNQSETETTDYYGRVFGHLLLLDGRLDQTVGVGYTRERTDTVSPDFPEELDIGKRLKVDYQGTFKLLDSPRNSQTLVFGAEHARDEVTEPLDAGQSIDSGYLELQSQFANRLFTAANVRYDSNSQFGHKATYRFAPTYVIAETGTQLKASVGTGFKAPTLVELYETSAFQAPNPNLLPEKSLGWDAGIEQALFGDAVQVGATYFHISLHDLIADEPVPGSVDSPTGPIYTYVNVDHATTLGVESFVSYRPWSVLTLRLDYTYTEATDDVLQEELLRRPKNKATLNADWQATTALSFNVDLLYVGNWIDTSRDFSVPRLVAPSYFTANVAGSYKLTQNFEFYGRIGNLLDRHYETPVGFQQPIFGVFGGIKVHL